MRGPTVLALLLTLALSACSSGPAGTPATTPSGAPPSETIPPVIFGTAPPGPTDGPEALVRDLVAAGLDARLGPQFLADPIAAQGVVVCLGSEPVQVYVFGSVRDRVALTEKIDPADPSNFGTSMITWNGKPRMWALDRLLIVYLGDSADTEALLRNALGEPFAVGKQGPPPLRDPACG